MGTLSISAQEARELPAREEISLRIHPNPAPGPTVEIVTNSETPKMVQVFDLFGKTMLRRRILGNTLDIRSLVPGVYMVRVEQEGRSTTKKLIIR